MVQRWRQLPLDHALLYAGRVRALIQSLADGLAEATGVPVLEVPDCGPATLMDQLAVMVYDTSAADPATRWASSASSTSADLVATTSAGLVATLSEDLASLRRALR